MDPCTDGGSNIVPGIIRAALQYGVQDRLLDCLTFDVTRSPIRRGGWVDAIVTDPPCPLLRLHSNQLELMRIDGVRAGAKRLGKKATRKKAPLEEPHTLPNGTFAHLSVIHVLAPTLLMHCTGNPDTSPLSDRTNWSTSL